MPLKVDQLYAPGSVVQIKSSTRTSYDSTAFSNTAWSDITDINVTITPKFDNSFILISWTLHVGGTGHHMFRLCKDDSPLNDALGDTYGNMNRCVWQWANNGGAYPGYGITSPCTGEFLDTSGTTANTPRTYKIQHLSGNSSAGYKICINRPYANGDNITNMNTTSEPYYGTVSSTITIKEIVQ